MWCGRPLEGRKVPLTELYLITHVAKYTLLVIHESRKYVCLQQKSLHEVQLYTFCLTENCAAFVFYDHSALWPNP